MGCQSAQPLPARGLGTGTAAAPPWPRPASHPPGPAAPAAAPMPLSSFQRRARGSKISWPSGAAPLSHPPRQEGSGAAQRNAGPGAAAGPRHQLFLGAQLVGRGGWVLLGGGHRRARAGGGSGSAHSRCIAGYQTLASRGTTIHLWFCSDVERIAAWRAPASHALPELAEQCSQLKGYRALGMHLPGAHTRAGERTGPQKHPSYAGQAGSQHPGHLRSRQPATVPSPPSPPPCRLPRRDAPAGQAAAGCSNPARWGPMEVGTGLPSREVSPAPCTGLGCSCLIPNLPRESG